MFSRNRVISRSEVILPMLKSLTVLFAVGFCALSVAPQTVAPSLTDQLSAVTARGRLLAEYDIASWHSTDAVQASHPVESDVEGYVAQKTDKGWVVDYGKLSENRDRFLIAYEATQAGAADKFDVNKISPPREDTGFCWKAALARETARKDFHGENRPYNFSVLPADSGQFYVYIFPAQIGRASCRERV